MSTSVILEKSATNNQISLWNGNLTLLNIYVWDYDIRNKLFK